MSTTGEELADAALTGLARQDPVEAHLAKRAYESLTQGGDLSSVTMLGLCDWLWSLLPLRWTCDVTGHRQAAAALGSLFELLEMHRYARLCRSALTMDVLGAWERGRGHGHKAMRAARSASGVVPPNIPGLITWGEAMGAGEASAQSATAAHLEIAIAAGELTPGARGWRKTASAITAGFLTASRGELSGQTWLDRIHAERLHDWVLSRGPGRAALTAALADRLAGPPPLPEDPAGPLAPVRWLIHKAAQDGGVPLTQQRTLARAVVAEGCERFGWLTLTGRPRSESDIPEAWTLRALVRELGIVRRQGRFLVLTTAGKQLAANGPADLWAAVIPALLPADRAEAEAAEIGLMLMLTGQHTGHLEFTTAIAETMASEGWHDQATGEPIGASDAGWLAGELHRRLSLLGLVEHRLGDERLTDAGRAAARTALRAHALRPRAEGGSSGGPRSVA